jgi:transposase
MGWYRVQLSEEQQRLVNAERDAHPAEHVRRKMLVLWLLHCRLTRAKVAEITGTGRATVQRYVAAFRDGGLDGLRRWDVKGPISDLAGYARPIRESFATQPVATIVEACARIEGVCGIRREPTQVRQFLKGLGLKWQRVRCVPVPPKKT